MELRQLHYFVTLAEELHFRRAAERMHIAQPAFSEQIQRLEGELGAKLFEPTSHYVRLTEAGKLFLQAIRPALAQVEQAAAVAARAGRGVFGTLTLGLAVPARSFAQLASDRSHRHLDPMAWVACAGLTCRACRPDAPRGDLSDRRFRLRLTRDL